MQTETCNNSVVVESMGSKFKLRFDDDVVHPSYYRYELEALAQAQESDLVCVTVHSDGGRLSTGIEVANSIFDCKAEVHGYLRGNCHSCGSIIFLACHRHELGLASEMLLHAGAGGLGGTPSQQIQRAESYKRQVKSLFDSVYKGFLSDEELALMIDHDKEYIFDNEAITERLTNMYKYRNGLQDTFYQEQDDAMYEENNLMVANTLASLDVSESDKETFNRIHKMIDDSLSEQDNPSLTGEPEASVTPCEKDELSPYLVELPFLSEEGTELGSIHFYQEGGNIDDVELVLDKGVFNLSDDSILLVDYDYLDTEDRKELLDIMSKVTGRKYTKWSTDTLKTAFVREVYRQIKENITD